MHLSDYLLDVTDLNLKMFVMSINTGFKISTKNKVEITSLIAKYAKDKNKLRLAAIEQYLGVTKESSKRPPKQQLVIPIINTNTPEHEELISKLNELRTEFMNNLKANNEGTIQRQVILRSEMNAIETKLGLYESKSDYEQYCQGPSETANHDNLVSIYRGLFGDFNNPNTIAWSFTHVGGMRDFQMSKEQAFFDPSIMYKETYAVTGLRPIAYNIMHHPVDLSWVFSLGRLDGNKILTDVLVGVR